jgi:hypothetical protein
VNDLWCVSSRAGLVVMVSLYGCVTTADISNIKMKIHLTS